MSENKKEVALSVWKSLDDSKWEHPDPRFKKIVLLMSANGFKVTKISELTGVNRQILNRYYKREMINGLSAVNQEIFNTLVVKALDPNNPKVALKAIELLLKYKTKLPSEDAEEDAVEPKNQSDAVKGMIDPTKLSVPELRQLTELLEKGRIDSPTIVIDAKVTRRE